MRDDSLGGAGNVEICYGDTVYLGIAVDIRPVDVYERHVRIQRRKSYQFEARVGHVTTFAALFRKVSDPSMTLADIGGP